jgi:predicted DNA binding protein/DNA-binding NarL/FixJ family response regulator
MTSADRLDILLVEDNPGDVRLLEELLEEATDRSEATIGRPAAGMDGLRHASTLDEGLQRLTDESIDVVLLDLGLPDSTGIETLETVRSHSPEVPIVVLTGLHDRTIGVQAVQHGAQEYLVKDELTPTLLTRSLRHAIERKKFQQTQTVLHEASRDLIQTESKAEVSQLSLDAAVDVVDHAGIAIYLFDESANVLRPTTYTDSLEAVFDEMPSFGPHDTAVAWEAFITSETITLEDLTESEYTRWHDTPFRSGTWIPLGSHGVLAIVAEESGGFDQQTQQLADHLAATAEAALDRVEREESLREHQRELTEQNQQLEDLDRMNGIIREIDKALVDATTREEIEQAVCDRLTGDGRFTFAWIGEVLDGERLSPRTWAGSDQGYLDAVSLTMRTENAPPAVTAGSTGEVVLETNVASGLREAPWRKAALARELQSAVSVPLTYNGMSYGVVTAFSTSPDVIGTRMEEVAKGLGETIANAMNSVETRQALLTDTVVELELAVHDENGLLGRIARQAGCQIDYGGIISQSSGQNRIFFTATGASASAIQRTAERVPSIQRLDPISEADGGEEPIRFEMTVSGPTVPSTLVQHGGVVQSARATESGTQVVVELPNPMDVRSFVDQFEETYSDTELVARRDKERADQSQQAFGTALTRDLTERQLEALQAAHHSGYFEWPRERTGEEVAKSLGITQPTFNGHLRAAERKLCTLLFDETSTSE